MAEIRSFCAWAYWAAKRCIYCGRRLSFFKGRSDSKMRDYIVPLSRGGEELAENIVACCRECHLLKGEYVNYSLLPPASNRSQLLRDIREYLAQARQFIGPRSSMTDLSR